MPALMYNADVEKFRFVFRWRHTVLPMVARDPIFWTMMVMHTWILWKEHQ